MKINKFLFPLWGGMLILCAGVGFIPEPAGALKVAMTVLAVLSFLPPLVLVLRGSDAQRHLVRCLAAASLGLTLALLVANLMTVTASETVGTVLYYLLVIVSSPMVCSGYWALSLFLWAFLLIMAGKKKK